MPRKLTAIEEIVSTAANQAVADCVSAMKYRATEAGIEDSENTEIFIMTVLMVLALGTEELMQFPDFRGKLAAGLLRHKELVARSGVEPN